MANSRRPIFTKRQKERAREEKRKQKAEKKAQKKEDQAAQPEGTTGEDPDLAGIVPGPQPLPDDY